MSTLNLLDLRSLYPHRFYSTQTWMLNESFMRVIPVERMHATPKKLVRTGEIPTPEQAMRLPFAVDLAHAFIAKPDDPIWESYLWCRDTDAEGHRIYLGGSNNSGDGALRRLEIHRHLTITERWGVPSI